MLILFDQGTPVGIRKALVGHTVKTAREQGWSTLLNGDLLRVAEENGFEVFVTPDQNLIYQQNLRGRKIAIVVLGQNRWKMLEPRFAEIAQAVKDAKPGAYVVLEIPKG